MRDILSNALLNETELADFFTTLVLNEHVSSDEDDSDEETEEE